MTSKKTKLTMEDPRDAVEFWSISENFSPSGELKSEVLANGELG